MNFWKFAQIFLKLFETENFDLQSTYSNKLKLIQVKSWVKDGLK